MVKMPQAGKTGVSAGAAPRGELLHP